MKFHKRAIHLTVLASMAGFVGVVAAPVAAHAATALPDSCGAYLQGNIDPAGGLIPTGLLGAAGVGGHLYAATGHESKGQDKIIDDVNNTGLGAKRISLSVVLGGVITGNLAANGGVAPVIASLNGGTTAPTSVTSVKLGWVNDKNTGTPEYPTVQVAESSKTQTPAKVPVAKGVVTGMPGADQFGVQTGNLTHKIPGGAEVDQVVIPAAAANADTYKLSTAIPVVGTLTTVAIPANASAATIASDLNSPAVYGALGGGVTVTQVQAFATGASNGIFNVNLTGVAALFPPTVGGAPSLDAQTTDMSAGMAAAQLDDGSIWDATRFGGPDPSITPISDLGNGVFTAQGDMSNGNINPVGGKLTGKANFRADTQYLFLQYPVALVNQVAPNLASDTALAGFLESITGPAFGPPTTDQCGFLGILALFCSAAASSVPATFQPICASL